MKCVVPGANVKILARAIHALSKIGDEIYVQPQEKSLSFRAVSSSNSAYSDFTFNDTYFSYYNYGNLNEDDVLKCKVPMRGAIAVFKTPSLMDKVIETCHIRLEPNASQLIFILKYKNSVVKTFLLPIIDCEALKAAYNKNGLPNILTVQPKVLVEALHNFQQSLVEITLDVKTDTIFMRNYIDDLTSTHITRTQLSLSIGEFDNYTVGENSCVTFCLKELRSILSFAEQVMVPIDITFESAGKPIVFILKNPAFEGNLVLSTLNPINNDSTNDTTMRERRALMKKRGRGIDKRTTTIKNKKAYNNNSSKASIASTSTSIVQSILSKDSISTTSTRTNITDKNKSKNNDNNNDDDNDNDNSLVSSLKSTSIDETKKTNNSNNKKTKLNQINKSPVTIPESLSPIGTLSSSTSSSLTSLTAAKNKNNSVIPPSVSSNNSRIASGTLPGLNKNILRPTMSSQSSEIPIGTPKIFSLARRSRQSFDSDNNNVDNFDDVIPDSPPPAKKAKIIFRKCLQETFDPRFLPGHDELLADDSDDENN